MTDQDELAQIRALLQRHADLGPQAIAAAPALWPDYDIQALAQEWQRAGFTHEGVQAWLAARCFSPWAAAELGAASVTSGMAAQRTELGEEPPDTIAFKCSARQLSIVDALVGLGVGTLVRDAEQEQRLAQRSEQLDDARSRLLAALDDLEQASAGGPVYPSDASDTAFAALTATRRLAGVFESLSRETYRPLAHAIFHDELERHEDALASVRVLADALEEIATQLLVLHDEHYQALGRGPFAPSHFGLRIVRRDGRDPDLHYGPDAR